MIKEEKYFNDGLDAYNNKDYEKAKDFFSKLIDKSSNSVDNAKLSEIYYMRGICHAQEYSIDEALADFNEAEKLGFDKSKIYCGRGIAYTDNGENDKAISNFDKAI
ncbi:tetratricopeptide repeat protein, partial [Brachyspira catarrhinii]